MKQMKNRCHNFFTFPQGIHCDSSFWSNAALLCLDTWQWCVVGLRSNHGILFKLTSNEKLIDELYLFFEQIHFIIEKKFYTINNNKIKNNMGNPPQKNMYRIVG